MTRAIGISFKAALAAPACAVIATASLATGHWQCLIRAAQGAALPDCMHLPGTTTEIARTPRANRKLEQLAIRLSHSIVAKESIYQRLVRDVGKIHMEYPGTANINYFPIVRGSVILLHMTSGAREQVERGQYHAWDCLNRHYKLSSFQVTPRGAVRLEFSGEFAGRQLASLYAGLPGMEWAEPIVAIGDSSTICVTPDRGIWHYVFDQASGDCASGCSNHDLTYFTVSDDGRVHVLDQWNNRSAEARPSWAQKYWNAAACRGRPS